MDLNVAAYREQTTFHRRFVTELKSEIGRS